MVRRILAALLVAIIFALLWATAFSAELEQVWVKRLGDIQKGPERPPIFAVAVGIDGNNRVYGAFESGSPGTVDALTEVYDIAQGTRVASSVYRGAGNGDDRPKDLLALAAGGYILAGETSVGGESHLMIARYTAPPVASAWEHVLQGSSYSGGAALCMVGQDKVAVAGNVYSETTGSDYYVAVYDVNSGNLVWESRFDGGGSGEDYSRRVAADRQGNVYVTGYSTRWRDSLTGSVVELAVAKLAAADGRVLWKSVNTRTAGAVVYEYPHGLAVDQQGNAIVTGQEWSANGDRMITAKYHSESGASLWIDRAGEQERGVLPGRGAAVTVTSNGDVVVTGTRSVRSSTAAPTRTEFVTIRYSGTNGSRQWVRSLSDQGFAYGAGYDVINDGDGGVWVTGIVSQAGQTDFYTARLDSKGQILAASAFDAFGSLDDGLTREAFSFHDGHKLVRTQAWDVVLVGNYISGGSSDGVLMRYRYSPSAPMVITGPATNISRNGAVLNATVTGKGMAGTAWLEWGLTTAYGGTGARKEFPQNGAISFNQPLREVISQPHTTLNFRVVASTATGTVYGANRTFVTNTVPQANPDWYHSKPDVHLQEFAVLVNDVDADGDKLEIIAITNGTYGTVALGANGVLRYTPGKSFYGNDSFSYTIADGFGGQATATVTLVDNAPLTQLDTAETPFEQAVTVAVMANDFDVDDDPLKVRSFDQGKHGFVEFSEEDGVLRYTPEPEFSGIDSFNYEVSDGWMIREGTVIVRVLPPAAPVIRTAASSSLPVPGAGEGRVPDGARWLSFGQPTTDFEGDLAFTASFVSQQGVQSGVFGAFQSADMMPVALSGDPAPGFTDAQFVSFSDPVVARFTDYAYSLDRQAVAFAGTVSGPGVTTGNDMGVWTTATQDGTLQLVLREGEPLMAVGSIGARVEAVQSLVLTRTGLWITVRLVKGRNAASRDNDVALLHWDGFHLRFHLREGDLQHIGSELKVIRTLSSLVPVRGNAGSVRSWDERCEAVLCRVTYTDGTRALTNGDRFVATTTDSHIPGVTGARWTRFGIPAIAAGEYGEVLSTFVAQMRIGSDRLNPMNSRGIFVAETSPTVYRTEMVVRQNDPVLGFHGVKIANFRDPVISSRESVAFIASLAGRGVNEKNREAVFWRYYGSSKLVARNGDSAPGIPDTIIDSITSVALPHSEKVERPRGPIFEARLRSGGKFSGNGHWAVDSNGVVQLLLRSGSNIAVGEEMKTLNRFSMLRPDKGSLAQIQSLDGLSRVVGRATFNDGSQALLRITLP